MKSVVKNKGDYNTNPLLIELVNLMTDDNVYIYRLCKSGASDEETAYIYGSSLTAYLAMFTDLKDYEIAEIIPKGHRLIFSLEDFIKWYFNPVQFNKCWI